jgi:hypothetical protein
VKLHCWHAVQHKIAPKAALRLVVGQVAKLPDTGGKFNACVR